MVDAIKTKKRGKVIGKSQGIDPVTGEYKEFLLIGEPKEFDTDYAKVFHGFTEKLLQDVDLAGKAIRLLFWIMKELEQGSIEFYMHHSVIREELGVSRDTFYRWKKTLEEKGLIKQIRPNIYQLNPACVVRGTGHTLLEEFKQPRLEEHHG